ncbi:unnamed protein product, partial [Didymodactylos carnosus]
YNPLVRPTQHSNETVNVAFGLLLVQLIHVYEKEQIMKTNTWLHMKWNDSQLRWNPERYGELMWIPPAIYKSSCRIDVTFFPFDSQECEMRFASWTYNAREVNFHHYTESIGQKSELTKLIPKLSTGELDEQYTDDYLESGTWNVLSIPGKFVHYHISNSTAAQTTDFKNSTPDYIEIVFVIRMSRKTLYYTVNLIVPTGLMGILICIVFCLPTYAGEKMTLCMSILLALNLFQLLVTKILPPTSAVVPLIAKYLLFTFTLNVLVIVNTVIITNFYYRSPMTHTMPNWIRRLFLDILPRLLLMKSPRLRARQKNDISNQDALNIMTETNDQEQSLVYQNEMCRSNEAQHHKTTTKRKKNPPTYFHGSGSSDSVFSYAQKRRSSTLLTNLSNKRLIHNNKTTTAEIIERRRPIDLMRDELIQALGNIRYIAAHCANEALIESIRDDWKFVATVIDRLQLVLFVTVTIVGTLAVLFEVPHIFSLDTVDPQKLVRFSNPNLTIHELIPSRS